MYTRSSVVAFVLHKSFIYCHWFEHISHLSFELLTVSPPQLNGRCFFSSSTRLLPAPHDFVIITFANRGESGYLNHWTRTLSSPLLTSDIIIHHHLISPGKVHLQCEGGSHRGNVCFLLMWTHSKRRTPGNTDSDNIMTEDYHYYLII